MNYLFENHRYQGWKPVITVLIGTGMRIGECLGLRWQDIDLENRTISVNHNFVHRQVEVNGSSFHINSPKTAAAAACAALLIIAGALAMYRSRKNEE